MSLEEVAHDSQALLTGMPASSGQVTGRVRVLLDLADIETIEPGEILVTRYTDTGWSYVFGILGGLVTEYGGFSAMPPLSLVNAGSQLLSAPKMQLSC